LDNATALQKLKSGELAGLVRVIGKPVGFFAQIPANSGLHLVPIPFSKTFADMYTLGEFTREEYPTLIPQGERIDTIAVPAVLAVFNWTKKTDRYWRVRRFTEALFTKWDKFLETHRHPKWRDVNLAATVPGWTRWSVAEEMLSRMQSDSRVAEIQHKDELQQKDMRAGDSWQKDMRAGGGSVLDSGINLTEEQREEVDHEFLHQRKQRESGESKTTS